MSKQALEEIMEDLKDLIGKEYIEKAGDITVKAKVYANIDEITDCYTGETLKDNHGEKEYQLEIGLDIRIFKDGKEVYHNDEDYRMLIQTDINDNPYIAERESLNGVFYEIEEKLGRGFLEQVKEPLLVIDEEFEEDYRPILRCHIPQLSTLCL